MNRRTFFAFLKPLPFFALVIEMESVSPSDRPNCRHATYTSPVSGSMAIVAPWLTRSAGFEIATGRVHVTPQLDELANMMVERMSGPEPSMTE